MKQYIIPALAILLLTGFFDNLFNGRLFVTVVIGPIYFLGCLALYMINEKKSRRVVFAAYLALLIAYFSLEALFREMYGG